MNAHPDGHMRSWTLEEMAAALRRQSRLLAICFLALSAGVLAAFATAPPLYDGKLRILVKRDRSDALVSGAPDPAAARHELQLSETEVMSQVELIKSDELVARVAAETGFTARVKAEDPSLTEAEALERATEALQKRLEIAPVKRTWLIDVAYQGDDRGEARRVLDTLVRAYLEKHLALQRPTGTFQFFAEQASHAREELEAAQQRLAAFTEQHEVVSAADEKAAVLRQLSEFDALRAEASARLAESNRRLAAVQAELERVPEQRMSEVRTDSEAITNVHAHILALEMKRAELLQKFTPEYRGVREVDGQIRQARAALAAAERFPVREETVADNPTRQWLDTELARTRAEQAALQARVRSLSSAVSGYRARAQTLDVHDAEQQDLERALKTAETKYLLYAQKQEEARISDELDRTRIANVVVAEGPTVAVEPRRDPSLALLPLLLGAALLLSAGAALVADALTPALRRWRSEAADRAPLIGHVSPSEGPLS